MMKSPICHCIDLVPSFVGTDGNNLRLKDTPPSYFYQREDEECFVMVDSLTISEAFEKYRVEYIVYRNQSSKTEEMSLCACKSLISYCGDIPIVDLTFDVVRKWKEHLSITKSDNTVRGYIIKLRVVLEYLRVCGYTDLLDSRRVGIPKSTQAKIDFLSPQEVSDFINAVEECHNYTKKQRARNRSIVSFLYGSGIRVSELCQLNIDDIRDDGTFSVVGKGRKIRPCFLDKRAQDHLAEYLAMRVDKRPALFLSELTGERITKDTVAEIFRNICKNAGITKHVHPHTMRHSFATNLLQSNTNLFYVSKFLGHASTQTTEQYLHCVDYDLQRAYVENHTI